MLARQTFSQYLTGQAAHRRPPFFFAYAGAWLHAIAASLLLSAVDIPRLLVFASATLSSLCLGIAIYGVLIREFRLLLNLGAYALIVGWSLNFWTPGSLLPVLAILAALVSTCFILSREYGRYRREVLADETGGRLPAWIITAVGLCAVLLCIFGLILVHSSAD